MPILPSSERRALVESPIVIVGAGACGLSAALAARESGAEVLVLERDATPFGNTSMSQGTVCAAGTRSQREQGVEDDAATFYADIMLQSENRADPAIARHVAQHSGPSLDWLIDQHDIPLAINREWSGFGHSRPRMHFNPSRTGAELHGALLRAAEAAGADIVTDAQVTDLFADADGTVTGVRIRRPDGTTEDIGCQALILASNGFGANHAMVERFAPAMASARYFGWEGNHGDGILWGMELGAAVGDMTATQNFGALAEPSGIMLSFEAFDEGCIQVDRDGRRFSNELMDISGQGDRVAALPGEISWVVLDERVHRRLLELPEYREAQGFGASRQAATIDALAAATAMSAEVLRETFAEIAASAASGKADRFGRVFPPEATFAAPYYAIRVGCALLHTLGGLIIDTEARVLRPDRTRFANLFAAGGCARNIAGPTSSGYLPGSGLCFAITLGRTAGQSAAAIVATTG